MGRDPVGEHRRGKQQDYDHVDTEEEKYNVRSGVSCWPVPCKIMNSPEHLILVRPFRLGTSLLLLLLDGHPELLPRLLPERLDVFLLRRQGDFGLGVSLVVSGTQVTQLTIS